MAIVEISDLSAHLNLPIPTQNEDMAILSRLIGASQAHIERLLGFKIEACFGGEDQDPVPEDLKQAVLMLAAHWYEHREAASMGDRASPVPFGVAEIVQEYREFTF